MTLGVRIRTLREKKGLTQAALAKQVKVKRQYLGRIERAQQLPSKKVFVRLARILEISFENLQKLYEDARLEMKIKNLGFKESEIIQLVKDFLKMSAKQKQAILRASRNLQSVKNIK